MTDLLRCLNLHLIKSTVYAANLDYMKPHFEVHNLRIRYPELVSYAR